MKYPPAPTLLALYHNSGPQASHRLGQNFLTDERLIARIADATHAGADTLTIEIGPGPGTLTALLAERAGSVIAIEYDQRQEAFHRKIFGDDPKVRFLYQDALRTDLPGLARKVCADSGLGRCVLTGNLPFQITSPLLFQQCGPQVPWSRMAFMVQKEVADRIVARPNGKEYGILTVKLGLWWRVIDRFEVPAAAFRPRPKVDASVLVFDPLPPHDCPGTENWKELSQFIDAAFNQRRKKLYNSLAERWSGATKGQIQDALAKAGLGPDIRAENLTVADFTRLYGLLNARADGY